MTGPDKTYRKACFLKILAVACIGLLQGAYGQSLTNQTNLFIPQELDVHLDGDFVNEGFIQNQGNLFVSRDWSNTNIYQGNGTIILNGLLPQRFFNNRNAVNNFVVDGVGSKTIVGLLPVTGQLGLSLGIVNVADADTLLLSGSAVVAGGSPESYVEGALTYVGVGFKFFPVGKNGSYYPVELLDISGINPVTEIEVFDDISSVNLPGTITRFSDVYWQRKNISGVFNGSPISLGYPIPDDYTNRHVIDILQSNGLDSEFSSLGDASVEYSSGVDKVISQNNSAGRLFVLGESVPVTGIPGEFYLSTSLSPRATNTDNQFVKVFGNQLTDTNFQFLVYNRWGLMVFETTSLTGMITKGWDGKHKGEYLPTGSYPFILKATKINGEVVEKKGMISIIN
jgi:hypothetical protein